MNDIERLKENILRAVNNWHDKSSRIARHSEIIEHTLSIEGVDPKGLNDYLKSNNVPDGCCFVNGSDSNHSEAFPAVYWIERINKDPSRYFESKLRILLNAIMSNGGYHLNDRICDKHLDSKFKEIAECYKNKDFNSMFITIFVIYSKNI